MKPPPKRGQAMLLTRTSRFLRFAPRGSADKRFSKLRPRKGRPLLLERLEDRTLLASAGLGTALPINLTGSVTENLRTPGEADSFQLTLPESGRLTAQVQPAVAGSGDPATT